MKKALFLTVALLFMTPLAHAQALGTSAPTATVTVGVNPEAALTIQTAALTLNQSGNNFTDYSGTTNFTYFIRTSQGGGGTGSITLEVTSDFTPTGGPEVGGMPTLTDQLYYSCSLGSLSHGAVTPCTGPVNSSTSAATAVAGFGADARSAKVGAPSSVTWGLSNDPLYQTGTYTATITYTISAS